MPAAAWGDGAENLRVVSKLKSQVNGGPGHCSLSSSSPSRMRVAGMGHVAFQWRAVACPERPLRPYDKQRAHPGIRTQ